MTLSQRIAQGPNQPKRWPEPKLEAPTRRLPEWLRRKQDGLLPAKELVLS